MAQFDLFWNPAESAWLLDIQHDILDGLSTRLVVPLVPAADAPHQIGRLNPLVHVNGKPHVLLTDLMSTVPRALLGPSRFNLAADRDAIIAAVDMLVTGI